jgi:hypothetical protein
MCDISPGSLTLLASEAGDLMELILLYTDIGLEVNADKTKYMLTSPDQNTGRSHNIKADNNSFETVEQYKYLGTN